VVERCDVGRLPFFLKIQVFLRGDFLFFTESVSFAQVGSREPAIRCNLLQKKISRRWRFGQFFLQKDFRCYQG